MRPRRPSIAHQSPVSHQATQSVGNLRAIHGGDSGDEVNEAVPTERAPLLSAASRLRSEPVMSFGAFGTAEAGRVQSSAGAASSRTSGIKDSNMTKSFSNGYDVNYPPSMPGSPRTGAADRDWRLEDAMLIDELNVPDSPRHDDFSDRDSARTNSPAAQGTPFERRHTYDFEAQGDVCFPHDGESETEMDNAELRARRNQRMRSRRRRIRGPQLAFLEEFAKIEKQNHSEAAKAKKITEPQLINGRLRPIQKGWYQPEEDAPYRFTYFNDEYQSTIHSSTISELVQSEGQGSSFRELFIPDRPILLDSSDSETEDDDVTPQYASGLRRSVGVHNSGSKEPMGTRQPSVAGSVHGGPERTGTLSPDKAQGPPRGSRQASGQATPVHAPRSNASPVLQDGAKIVRYGERPVWWLDVLSPTDVEMRVIARTFGIHGLTTEDIMMQEAREKVELFQHYYFVHYRTFNQDPRSEDYLEPINLYIVVFRDGVLSFHFSPTPHPANVRRRVRMLRDYMFLTPDWIAYAIIDDITDVYQPLIQSVEEEVDDIDADIVKLHAEEDPRKARSKLEKMFSDDGKSSSGSTFVETGADMLRRVGECRKKVMGLYRLLGSKADVIKGFAKRCNEQWEVAPRSDIGIYLGDIQDHIVTMTGNLSHYEM